MSKIETNIFKILIYIYKLKLYLENYEEKIVAVKFQYTFMQKANIRENDSFEYFTGFTLQ